MTLRPPFQEQPPINRIESVRRELISDGRELLHLISGNPNDQGFIFPANILEEAYARFFRDQHYHPYSKGTPAARKAIAEYYARQGASVDPEHVVLTAGTSESFLYLFKLLGNAGDNFLAPNPAYPLFDHIAHMAGVEMRHYPLSATNHWQIDFETLRRLTNFKTRAIVLVSPNNPTGAVVHADEVGDVVHWANLKNIPIICDEVFSEFFFGSGSFPRPMAVAKPKLCFTLNGISKMFALPALKLGWIAVTGDDSQVNAAVDHLETTADTFLSCHTPIQEALPDLFQKGGDFVKSYVAEVGKRRQLAMELLASSPHLHFVSPVGGFYMMLEVTKRMALTEEEFVIALMKEAGVFVHPGYFFDYEKGLHVVISYLTRPEALQRGLAALTRFVEER